MTQQQEERIVQSSVRLGILKSYDGTAKTASVQLIGALSRWLDNVPVNLGLATGEWTAGRFVLVAFPEPNNPALAVVIAVWV